MIRVAAAGGDAPTLDPRVRGSLVHALLEQPGPAGRARRRRRGRPRRRADGGRDRRRRAARRRVRAVAARGAGGARAQRAPRAPVRGAARRHAAQRRSSTCSRSSAAGRSSSSTTRPTRSTRKPTSTRYVAERYDVQRRVYALAALRGGAARVDVAYAFLERPGEPVCDALRRRRRRPARERAAGARRRDAGRRVPGHARPAPGAVRDAAPGGARCARIRRSARSPSARRRSCDPARVRSRSRRRALRCSP